MKKTLVVISAIIGSIMYVSPSLAYTKSQNDVERFSAPPLGKGRVIFYRISRHSDGYFSSCRIHDRSGGVDFAFPNIGGNKYMVVDLAPGVHELSVKIESTDRLRLEIEPDETYFVQCVMATGVFIERPDLRPSTEEEFRSIKKMRPNSVPSYTEAK